MSLKQEKKIQKRINQSFEEISAQILNRDAQIKEVLSLFEESHISMIPPNIFVSGPNATGKTITLKAIAQRLSVPNVAWVDCSTKFTPRLVFESVLMQIEKTTPYPKGNAWVGVQKCETIHDFATRLMEVLNKSSVESRKGKKRATVDDEQKVDRTRNLVTTSNVDEGDEEFDEDDQQLLFDGTPDSDELLIVFDEAEKLRDMGSNLLKGLLRLREFTRCNITCVFVSHLCWVEFQTYSETVIPYTIYFPAYTTSDMIKIISMDCPPDQDLAFYLGFVEMIYKVFVKPCNKITELRHLVTLLFPKYIEPIVLGKVKPTETRKLFSNIQYHIRDALQSLYLREISSSEWQRRSIEKKAAVALKKIDTEINLSYYSKFLLIASFLASYNPPKFDTQFFTKNDISVTGKRKRGRPKTKKKLEDANSSAHSSVWRQQLLGPKPFPLERMLAIFYSIIEDDVDTTVDIYHQIALLIKLKLLIQMTSCDNIENMKCKCNVGFDSIRNISKSLRFEISRYLYEFN